MSAWTGKLSDLEVDVEDFANITCEFNGKLLNKKVMGSIHLDFIRQDQTRFCEIIGTKGTMKFDAENNEIFIKKNNRNDWVKIYNSNESRDDSFSNQLSYFCFKTGFDKI